MIAAPSGFENFRGIDLIPANLPSSSEDFARIFDHFNPEDFLDPRIAEHLELKSYVTFPVEEEDATGELFLSTASHYRDGVLSSRILQAGLPTRGPDLCIVTLEDKGGQWRLAVNAASDPYETTTKYAEQTTDSGLSAFLGWIAGTLAQERTKKKPDYSYIPVQLETAEFDELWHQVVASTQAGSVQYGAAIRTELNGKQVVVRAKGERGGAIGSLVVSFDGQFELSHISDNPLTVYDAKYEGEDMPSLDDLAGIPHPFHIQKVIAADGTKAYSIKSAIEGLTIPDIPLCTTLKKAQQTADNLYRLLVRAHERYNTIFTRHGAARVTRLLGQVATSLSQSKDQ